MANQWFIKTFKKNRAVRAIIHYPDHRVRSFWAIPKENLITIAEKTYRCDTRVDYFNIWNGIPCFTYIVDQVEPVRLDEETPSKMSSDEFNVAINNRVVREVFAAADKKMDLITAVIVGMVAVVIIVGIAGYFIYQEMQTMKTSLDLLKDYFGITGIQGGVPIG